MKPVVGDGRPARIRGNIPENGAVTHQIEGVEPLSTCLLETGRFAGKGLRMKPVMRDGEIIGMRLAIKRVEHRLYRLGLRSGDIAKSVNRTATTDAGALTKIYRAMRESDLVILEVERRGAGQISTVELF